MMKIINWFNENEGFVLAILTAVTVFIAIKVPTHIAKEQNKIALYEKRFECYQQLKSLETFWMFVKDISTFSSSVEKRTNPVWCCQQQYFNAHSLLDDKNFQRNRLEHFFQISYANSCLATDCKMILSLKLLICADEDEKQFEQMQTALKEFISELFSMKKDETQGGDSNERLLDKRDNFVTKFEETFKLENKLEELLKIEMKKPKKMRKRKVKQK